MQTTLARVIDEQLAARGWRKGHLVAAMGYKNLSRGVKRLEACLRGEDAAPEVLRRLGAALEIAPARWEAILRATRTEREAAARADAARIEAARRAAFRPYVYVQTSETRPQSLTAAAVIGPRLKQIALDDDTLALPPARRLVRVAELVREHYRVNLGRCLLFGVITGYLFRSGYEETIAFATDGTLLATRPGWHADEGIASLTLKGLPVPEGLFAGV
jgi:hypothetical protein